ncbi:FRIGIDA-like protein 4a [Typha angustifolia]|uniref:FRIGIDA-like protein 4a n=1 Tax=Typha angustifolia TaxID=59011 RepID=UPI003C2B69F0
MAADVVSSDLIKKALDDLESQKSLLNSCTLLLNNLSDHFASFNKTLTTRSQALDADLQNLDSTTHQTLESLSQRESSIPDRECAATELIRERRAAAVAEIEAAGEPPAQIRGVLQWLCRRMDSPGLWQFMVSHRRDLSVLRREIGEAVAEAVDPPRLVVDAIQDFLDQQDSGGDANSGGGGHDPSWAFGMLLMALFYPDRRKAPEVSGSMRERAAAVAEAWKKKLDGKEEREEGVEGEEGVGRSEVQLFLQIVAAFGLSSRFDEEFLRKLFMEHSRRREMARLAPALGFGEKLADIIEELAKNGKEVEAVYIAHESGLIEQFPPTPLLKSYLQAARKKANAILKSGNRSVAAMEESRILECNAMRSIIKCVEACKLESKFSIEGLRKKLSQMERAKSDRRRSAAANFHKKRARTTGDAPSSRPAKASRSSNAAYPSFHRNPTAVPPAPASRHSYNYPGQGGFGSPVSASYAQSPTAAPQQFHVPEEIGKRRSAMPYGGATLNYGAYDYAAPHSVPQPSYPH